MATIDELTKRQKELYKELDRIENKLGEATGQEFESLISGRNKISEELDRIDSTFCHGLWDY